MTISIITAALPGANSIPDIIPRHRGIIILRNGISLKSTVCSF
jgi:hypothetical protein